LNNEIDRNLIAITHRYINVKNGKPPGGKVRNQA